MIKDNSAPQKDRLQTRLTVLALVVTVTLATAYLLYPVISNPRLALFAGDYNMIHHLKQVDIAKYMLRFDWDSMWILGGGTKTGARVNLALPLLALLPMNSSLWVIIGLHILIAASGGWFCARVMGCSRWGSAVAGVAFGLTGHFVTLVNAGHMGKVECIPWIPWTFAFFVCAWETGHWRYFLYTAMTYALMFLSGEPQVAYYLGLYLALYAVIRMIALLRRRSKAETRQCVSRALLSACCVVFSVFLAWQSIVEFTAAFATQAPATRTAPATPGGNNSQRQVEQQKEAAYDFATSWSYPIEETAIFLMSGKLFGIQSPVYWGKHGTKEFHMTEVDHYMGSLVVVLMFVGCVSLRNNRWSQFLFFVMISSLVIAYGRFTPVYRLIYELPTMSSQRIPARWIALTAFSLCMLAGHGFDVFAAWLQNASTDRKPLVRMTAISAFLGVLFLAAGSALAACKGVLETAGFGPRGYFEASQTPALAKQRADLFTDAFSRTGFLLLGIALLILLCFWLFHRRHSRHLSTGSALALAAVLCMAFIAADLVQSHRNYIRTYDWEQFYARDQIVDFFLKDTDLFRIQMLGPQQHPYANQFISSAGPWFKLRFAEAPVVSRVNPEFEKFFTLLSVNQNYRLSPRYYDVFNIKYVFSAFELPAEILSYSRLTLRHKIPFNNLPPLYVYQYSDFTPNPMLVAGTVQASSQDEALVLLASRTFSLTQAVVGVDLPDIASTGPIGESPVLEEFQNGTMRIKATCSAKAWLLIKEAFDPGWTATIDGQPSKVYRVNYYHSGVPLSPGTHLILFQYRPDRRNLFVTLFAWAIGLVLLVVAHSKPHISTDTPGAPANRTATRSSRAQNSGTVSRTCQDVFKQ